MCWSCWILMGSSQALHLHAVAYTINSELPYEYSFYFHSAHPFCVCLSCLSTKDTWGTNEVEGRGEWERGRVGWRVVTSGTRLLLRFVGCKTTHVKPRWEEPHNALDGCELCKTWCKPTSGECSVTPAVKLCSKEICFLYFLMATWLALPSYSAQYFCFQIIMMWCGWQSNLNNWTLSWEAST